MPEKIGACLRERMHRPFEAALDAIDSSSAELSTALRTAAEFHMPRENWEEGRNRFSSCWSFKIRLSASITRR